MCVCVCVCAEQCIHLSAMRMSVEGGVSEMERVRKHVRGEGGKRERRSFLLLQSQHRERKAMQEMMRAKAAESELKGKISMLQAQVSCTHTQCIQRIRARTRTLTNIPAHLHKHGHTHTQRERDQQHLWYMS